MRLGLFCGGKRALKSDLVVPNGELEKGTRVFREMHSQQVISNNHNLQVENFQVDAWKIFLL